MGKKIWLSKSTTIKLFNANLQTQCDVWGQNNNFFFESTGKSPAGRFPSLQPVSSWVIYLSNIKYLGTKQACSTVALFFFFCPSFSYIIVLLTQKLAANMRYFIACFKQIWMYFLKIFEPPFFLPMFISSDGIRSGMCRHTNACCWCEHRNVASSLQSVRTTAEVAQWAQYIIVSCLYSVLNMVGKGRMSELLSCWMPNHNDCDKKKCVEFHFGEFQFWDFLFFPPFFQRRKIVHYSKKNPRKNVKRVSCVKSPLINMDVLFEHISWAKDHLKSDMTSDEIIKDSLSWSALWLWNVRLHQSPT